MWTSYVTGPFRHTCSMEPAEYQSGVAAATQFAGNMPGLHIYFVSGSRPKTSVDFVNRKVQVQVIMYYIPARAPDRALDGMLDFRQLGKLGVQLQFPVHCGRGTLWGGQVAVRSRPLQKNLVLLCHYPDVYEKLHSFSLQLPTQPYNSYRLLVSGILCRINLKNMTVHFK